MTKSWHPAQLDGNGWHHYEGDFCDGKVVDVRVAHCPRHQDHLKADCAACAKEAARAPQQDQL